MSRTRMILQKLLHPPVWALICIPVLSFSALAAIFTCQSTKSTLTYLVYGMSAYSLTIWSVAVPALAKRVKSAVTGNRIAGRYLSDLAFRGSISLYQGMAVNLIDVAFRMFTGLRYGSVWFLSMAVYHLVLGGLRLYLIAGYRRKDPVREYRCYRATAWLLFLLNIPMGGMIVLMVQTNSGFFYPGYVLYLSALYAFYAMTTSVINFVRFRRLGSPILSAAKVLNVVAAMMSILGLQTAMLSRFSEKSGEYRRMMNTITGGFVYGTVILIAVFMLRHARVLRKRAGFLEQI